MSTSTPHSKEPVNVPALSLVETENRRIDDLLRLLCRGLLVLAALFFAASAVLGLLQPGDFGYYAALLGILAVVELLRQRGQLKAASLFFSAAFWLLTALFNAATGSYSPFIMPLLCAMLLLGWRGGAFFTVLSIAFGLVYIIVMDSFTLLLNDWFLLSSIFAVEMLLLWATERHMLRAYESAYGYARQAADMNVFLYEEIMRQVSTEAALRQSEARYRQLIDISPMAMVVTDLEDQVVLYLNQAGATLTGYPSADALIGTNYTDIIAPDDLPAMDARRQSVLEGDTAAPYEVQILRENGDLFTAEATSIPIVYQGRRAALTLFTDITERKRIQEAHLRNEVMRTELEKEQRYVLLRQNFVTMASHQFRTPLSVILSSRDLLDLYYDRMTPEKRSEHLDKIRLHAHMMVDLLDDLLTISKASAHMLEPRPQPMPIERFCRLLVEDFANSHPDHLYHFSGTLEGMYLLDERLTRHALLNLLSNASKYSPAGQPIEVTLRQVSGEEAALYDLPAQADMLPRPPIASDAPYACITIRDYGVGIPPGEQERLFETFYRASNAQFVSGTGLGLTIAKIFIETQGGFLSFESTLGEGTTFTLLLPLQTEAHPHAAPLRHPTI